jgi:hypothetical protein
MLLNSDKRRADFHNKQTVFQPAGTVEIITWIKLNEETRTVRKLNTDYSGPSH